MNSLLSGLVTSRTRIKLLVRLFANPATTAYLRGLAEEFDVSTNAVREELNRLNKAKLLTSEKSGREVHYRANQEHPLFSELSSMVKKLLGIDQVISNIINRVGRLEKAILIDDYAQGQDSGVIDLLLVGQIDHTSLLDLVHKTEKYINRRIRTLTATPQEFEAMADWLNARPNLVLWENGSGKD